MSARHALAFVLAIFAAPASGQAFACGAETACVVEGGEYFVRLPDGWNGKSPLGAVVFFHGYSSSAEDVMAFEGLSRGLADAGVMLVAPQGSKDARGTRTWAFPGGSTLERDDFAYVGRVLDDVERRWPVDRKRLLASGFSVGGSMVWFIACRMPERFAAFAPVAGAFWAPEPDDCPGGPVSLRHTHGLADKTVPMAGRPLRNGRRQGDVLRGMALWRRIDGCPEEPARVESSGGLVCRTWPAAYCSSHRELVLCLHQGEHEIDPKWVLDGVRWLDALNAKTAAH